MNLYALVLFFFLKCSCHVIFVTRIYESGNSPYTQPKSVQAELGIMLIYGIVGGFTLVFMLLASRAKGQEKRNVEKF